MNDFIKSLRRITSKGLFIPEIDGLRFLAIVPVVIMHAHTNYNRSFPSDLQIHDELYNHFINQGGKGVWIFFAISGFILSYAFARHFHVNQRSFKELNLKGYFLRRLTRLEPPFIISTLTLFLFTSLFLVGSFKSLLPNLLASLAYSHVLIFGKWSPINPVTWSLEVEIQFYVLAPFVSSALFIMAERLRNIILIILIFLIPLLVIGENSIFVTNPHFSKTIPVFIQHFFVGILLASLYSGKYWKKIRSGYLWDLLCFGSIILAFYITPDVKNILTFYAFDFFLLIIMIGAFKGRLVNLFFSNSVIATFGGMCYSIYLIHYAVIYGVGMILNGVVFNNAALNYGFHMGVSILVVTILSIIFFKFFEKPFMDKHWPQKVGAWWRKTFYSSRVLKQKRRSGTV